MDGIFDKNENLNLKLVAIKLTINDIVLNVEKRSMMINEARARATRQRPVIANSHEAGAERAHVYSILAATMNSCDDIGHSARRRYLGDDILLLKEQRRYWGSLYHYTSSLSSLHMGSVDQNFRIV